ncbi:MAG: hypothetical protein U0797_17640 [Gemmataceae bacterium]
MDCNTARVYLQLGGLDADELQEHLGLCTTCTHLAQDQKRLDDHLGRAMRAVEVPRGPREELLRRLAAEHGARQRRWAGYAFYGGLAAAAMVLAWGLYSLWGPGKPVISGDQVVRDFNILRPDQDASDYQLRRLGAKGGAPSFVNYAYLVGEPSLAILPGTQDDKSPVRVPQFTFARRDERRDQRAVVFVVPRRQYTIEDVGAPDPAYPWQLRIEYDEDDWKGEFAYLILHTGNDWDWLKLPKRPE